MSVNDVTRRNWTDPALAQATLPVSPQVLPRVAQNAEISVTDQIVAQLSAMGKDAASVVGQLVTSENGVLLPLENGSGSAHLRLDSNRDWVVVSDASATHGPTEFHWTELRRFVFEELKLDAQFGGIDRFAAEYPDILEKISPSFGPDRVKSEAELDLLRMVRERMRRTGSQNLYAPVSARATEEATTTRDTYAEASFLRSLNKSRLMNDVSNTHVSLTYVVRDEQTGTFMTDRTDGLSAAGARALIADLDGAGRLGKGISYDDVFTMNGIGGYAGPKGGIVPADADLARREAYFALGLMNDDERVAAVQSNLEPFMGRLPTAFSERSFDRLAKKCCEANALERGTVSMAFPARAEVVPGLSTDQNRENPQLPAVSTDVTFLYLDVTPTEAMELLQQDNLLYPPRDILEANGLSLEGLSVREAILEQRLTGEG